MTPEHRERLQAMAADASGLTWDLSDNDRAAIAALLAELGNGERLFDMALVRNRALEEAAQAIESGGYITARSHAAMVRRLKTPSDSKAVSR